jgi:hypothetical protein
MTRLASAAELRSEHPIPDHFPGTHMFLVHDGDLELEGDLSLDWAHWQGGAASGLEHLPEMVPDLPANLCGLLVTGRLRLSGALRNAGPEAGVALIVRGDVDVRQASCGGAYIRIDGRLCAQELVYAHYNDGELHLRGGLCAKALIQDDHFVDLHGSSHGNPSGPLAVIDLSEQRDPDDDERLPKALKKLLGNSTLSLSAVRDGLRQCVPPAGLSRPQTPQQWRDAVWKDYAAVRKLPRPLRTEPTYLLMLEAACPLPGAEIAELVATIPIAALTERVRLAAFMCSPKSLLRLPAAFDLCTEYARCLAAVPDPASYLDEVPESFRPQALQRGGRLQRAKH